MFLKWRRFNIFLSFLAFPVLCSVTRCQILVTEDLEYDSGVQFCSFFGRRSPQPEPLLKQCAWYKDSSCCRERERLSYFLGNAKILSDDFNKTKLTPECFKYLGYLMCYVCAPNQNAFFRGGRLSICRRSCDLLYDQCKTSYIDIFDTVERLYENGSDLCFSRKFAVVDDDLGKSCFLIDPSLYGSSVKPRFGRPICVSMILLAFATRTWLTSPSSYLGCLSLLFLTGLTWCCSFFAAIGRICKGTARHFASSWSGKVTLIFVCLQLLCLSDLAGTQTLTVKEVQSWADALSDDMKLFASSRMSFAQFKKLYDDVGYEVVNIDPAEELKKVSSAFEQYISEKQNLTRSFVRKVKELHAQYQASGLPDSNVERSLENLPQSVYMDADRLFQYHLPPEVLKYDYRVGRSVVSSQSTVKLPDSIQRDSHLVVDTVNWTSNLEAFFRQAKLENPFVRYLYFGSSTGVFRIYPGVEWPRDFIGFPTNYEPRMQQWYMSRKTGPKDIVFIIDGSLSMQGASLRMAQSVIRIILNMLNHQYYVNAIVSASKVYNVKGSVIQPEAKARVLSCSEDSLVPAMEHNLQELRIAIQNIQAAGGSDHLIAFQMAFKMFDNHRRHHESAGTGCRNMIFFITDGREIDGDLRCTEGAHIYMEDNSKKFNPGNICHFKYDYIIDAVNLLKASVSPMHVNIFTFLTNNRSDKTDTGEYLAGKLACENQGVMSAIIDERDYFNQMKLFFRFMESHDTQQRNDQFLSSYYHSPGDQSIVITMTQPADTDDNEHLGVVGIDIPLEKLESLFRDSLWARVYAFVVILTDGSPLIHPLMKLNYRQQDKAKDGYLGLYSLETVDGQPEQFSDVMKMLLRRDTGSVKITINPRRAVRFKLFAFQLPTTASEYFVTHIADSDYSIGVNIFPPDLTYRKLKEFTGANTTSYLHTLLETKDNPQISARVAELEPQKGLNEGRLYTGVSVSTKHSVVALSFDSFCKMSNFYDQFVEGELEYVRIQNAINDPAQNSCSILTVLTHDASQDIKITRAIEDVWLARTSAETTGVISTYLLTVNGVMRIYPGVAIPGSELADIMYQDWYLNALLHRGFLSVLMEHPSRHPPTMVVTLSQALLSGDINCTESSAELCAELGLIGVLAVDVESTEFRQQVDRSLKSASGSSTYACGAKSICNYKGREYQCETKCLLIDSTANFVSLLERNIVNETYPSFAEKYPFILNHLINVGVFNLRRTNDTNADCDTDESAIKDEDNSNGERPPIMGSYYDGPVPLYVPEVQCIREIIYYIHNRTRINEFEGLTVTASLEKDPCYEGEFFVSLVKETNLYLVVIKGYVDLSNDPFNFICFLSTQALSTDPDKVTQFSVECEGLKKDLKEVETYRRTCLQLEQVPVSCGFDDACRVVPNSFEVAVVTVLFHSLLVLLKSDI